MKKENLRYLIHALIQSSDWLTAQEIAVQMHITTRSVRNYISEINAKYNCHPIIASPLGYKWNLDSNQSAMLLDNQPTQIVDTPEQRYWFIIKKVIFLNTINSHNQISVNDICDELIISESAFLKDIDFIRKSLKNYCISLHIKNDNLSISGEEVNLRHLQYDVILHFSNEPILYRSYLINSFPQFKIDTIYKYLVSSLTKHDLSCDSFHINHLVLYILIQIIRIKNNKNLNASAINIPNLQKLPEYQASLDFSKQLSDLNEIQYSWWELEYLSMLLLGFSHNIGNLPSEYNKTKQEVNDCLQHLSKNEGFITIDENLINQITDFFEKIKIRSDYFLSVINPMRTTVRSSFPIAHDEIAWIATYFRKKWQIQTNSNEISYLTMILSTYLRQHKKSQYCISTTLVCPDFYDISNLLKDHLEDHFKSQISINEIFNTLDIDQLKPNDLLISIIPLESKANYVHISPDLTSNDYAAIQRKINQIKKAKRFKDFSMFLQCYSSADQFELNHYFYSRDEAIEYICNKLQKNGVIDHNFKEIVLDREETESTSYYNFIAVPHAAVSSVKKNSIYIILNKKSSSWGNRQVNLILFFAMSHGSMLDYRHFYQTIIQLFEEKSNMVALLQANNYSEFIDILYSLYKTTNK